ncbi:hypothetical protein [Candidatus Magnetominusculus xianensis]|uniref:Uncharacterized protein n=1 Tax=Candidatus Magnetominusculus xianensis TaxID=1748249 RepID=A0ABR5SAQ0_9BACT|nr:hypothetical protein [Candidatus Magnetominusculus xianensis]KWT73776.1 hypothetical protein ASN18_3358 [Candidatus Magnetominusculus xianensis]MBF0404797.1 hypothetical protein [Nitrospirota bacterium]
MTIAEIISLTRGRLRDSVEGTYFSDDELLAMLNDTIEEFCRETLILEDSQTPEICSIPVVEGQGYYTLDRRIIFVTRAYLANYGRLEKINAKDLDWWYYKWESTAGCPHVFIADLETQKLRLYPTPDNNYQLNLSVFRMPLKRISKDAEYPNMEPEINPRHHYSLIDGIVSRAYQTNDSQTFDFNFYQLHLSKWRDYCQKIKQEANRTRQTETSVSINPGLL